MITDYASSRCSLDGVACDPSPCGFDAPRLRLARRPAPSEFPGLAGWFRAARSDALGLFPERCYEQLRVDQTIGLTRLVVVSDPETIRPIFTSHQHDFALSNLHLRILKPSLGKGLIVAQGDDWRRLRRASLAVIRHRNSVLREDAPYRSALAFARTHGAAPDFPAHLSRFALDLLAVHILGHHQPVASPQISAAIERHRSVTERIDLLDMFGVNARISSHKMRHAARIASEFDDQIVEEFAASPRTPPERIKLAEHRDFIVNLLTGFESLWLTCLWALLTIAKHPELLKWLRSSGDDRVLRQRLQRVTLETLRLYPPLPLIYRKARRDVSLPSGAFRRNQLLCISPYIVHHHSRNWEEPDVFAMDRPLSIYRGLPYMPFGIGARRCVGAGVSPPLITEVLLGLLAHHDPVSETEMPLPRMGLSLRPDGAYTLRLAAR